MRLRMAESEQSGEKWLAVAPELRLRQLDHLESDAVNIQCINSSDFVVGRQINFNGPVTIVNCANAVTTGEKIVIRDKVLSQTAAMKVQKIASMPDVDQYRPKWTSLSWIFVFVCVGLLLAAGIALSVTMTTAPMEEGLRCNQVSDICIYPRADWGVRTFEPLKVPLRYVVVSQTNGSFCYDVDTCLKVVEIFNRKDLGCNFLAGSDGNIYEGRGWEYENALEGPVAGKALEICFLGDYSVEYPTYPQVASVKVLIRVAVEEGHLTKDYILTSGKIPLEGPVPSIYDIIKKWPNFSDAPSESVIGVQSR